MPDVVPSAGEAAGGLFDGLEPRHFRPSAATILIACIVFIAWMVYLQERHLATLDNRLWRIESLAAEPRDLGAWADGDTADGEWEVVESEEPEPPDDDDDLVEEQDETSEPVAEPEADSGN